MIIGGLISIKSTKIIDKGMDIEGVIVIILLSYFMATYFISMHGDISEGIMISIFLEEKLTDKQNLI